MLDTSPGPRCGVQSYFQDCTADPLKSPARPSFVSMEFEEVDWGKRGTLQAHVNNPPCVRMCHAFAATSNSSAEQPDVVDFEGSLQCLIRHLVPIWSSWLGLMLCCCIITRGASVKSAVPPCHLTDGCCAQVDQSATPTIKD